MDKLTATLIWMQYNVEEVKEGFIPRKEESFYWRPRNLRRFTTSPFIPEIQQYTKSTYCMPKGLIRYKKFIAAMMYRYSCKRRVVVVYKYSSPKKYLGATKKKYYLPTKN